MNAPARLTRTQRWLIGTVITGATLIAGIGFAGSYTAVTNLAIRQGFGRFAYTFAIGVDAGIAVLLALDLLLTWLRIPFPLLRQVAWLLTAATIAFNAAAARSPLGMGMHAVIPLLFVVSVEAARHAVGRIADITADQHMEPVRMSRWLLDPVRTFFLWRRMKLWELRSYEQVLKLEQERLIERARLRNRYGRRWRSKAPAEAVLALRLTRYGLAIEAAEALCEMDPAASQSAPLAALGAPLAATLERPERPTKDAPGAPRLDAPERSEPAIESAPEALRQEPAERPESAPDDVPEAPQSGASQRPESAPAPKQKAPRKTPPKRPGKVTRTDAKAALKALYSTLSRRPVESELIDELKRIGYPHTSRQHANKLRSEIEADEPHLAALGSDNVRALTGTEG